MSNPQGIHKVQFQHSRSMWIRYPRVLSGESYKDICTLADLSMIVKNTNTPMLQPEAGLYILRSILYRSQCGSSGRKIGAACLCYCTYSFPCVPAQIMCKFSVGVSFLARWHHGVSNPWENFAAPVVWRSVSCEATPQVVRYAMGGATRETRSAQATLPIRTVLGYVGSQEREVVSHRSFQHRGERWQA